MSTKPPANAVSKPAKEILRGDIVAFKDFHTGEWLRGIVYNPFINPKAKDVHNPENEDIAGFRVLPVATIGYRKTASASPYETLEKTNASIVTQAGGTARMNKTVVSFNLRSVANKVEMTGSQKREILVVGSYWGSPYMTELNERVSALYNSKELYIDGKKIEPEKQIAIISARHAQETVLQNRFDRNRTLANLGKENETTGTTTIAAISRDLKVTPKAVVKSAATPAPKSYDINLRDIIPFLHPGGEMAGVARMRGGADHSDAIALPIKNPATGEPRTIETLRGAWTFIKAVSPDENAALIASALKPYGGLGVGSAEKLIAKIKALYNGLNDIREQNGAPATQNPQMAKIVESGTVFAIK